MITEEKTIGNTMLWQYAIGILDVQNSYLSQQDERTRKELLALELFPDLKKKYLDWCNSFLVTRSIALKAGLKAHDLDVTIKLEFVWHDDFSIAIKTVDE